MEDANFVEDTADKGILRLTKVCCYHCGAHICWTDWFIVFTNSEQVTQVHCYCHFAQVSEQIGANVFTHQD